MAGGQRLLQALKELGGASYDLGKTGVRAGKEFAVSNPKTASALGGAGASALLMKLLGSEESPEQDSEEQLRRMRSIQMFRGE